jgi:hypothetical protein
VTIASAPQSGDLRENESRIFLQMGLDRLLGDLPVRHVQHLAAVAAASAPTEADIVLLPEREVRTTR